MKKKSLIAALLLCSVLLLSIPHAAFAKGSLKGIVTNLNGQPLMKVLVNVTQSQSLVASVTTDYQGRYEVKSLSAGTYSVRFRYSNYVDSTAKVVVVDGRATTVSKQMAVRAAIPPQIKNISLNRPVAVQKSQSEASRGIVYDQVASGATHDIFIQPGGGRYFNPSTEEYKKEPENDFRSVSTSPLSTLSVDVDRASYSNIRRMINQGQKPDADAVRIEEMINYFDYNYPQPARDAPVAITTETIACPWNPEHLLLHIGLQARKVNTENLPASNLVFLIDVSGSMGEANKLPLLKASFKLLVDNLRDKDRVAIVVYAGNAGLVLPPTPGSNKGKINDALENLSAGGSTAGGEGIELAYKTAEEHFIKGGNNRIILATDGDFNVGVSNNNELEQLISSKRNKGIFLTCLGFGMGNYKDAKMELLADKGNGNYAYIDNLQEARKTLVSEFGGTLFTVAKDVKAQVEFNPLKVQGYRLVGYENRLLNAEDFKDDTKDAGEMGAGHSVTILYEVIPAGADSKWVRPTERLKYQQVAPSERTRPSNEMATVRFRYKQPNGNSSKELVQPINYDAKSLLQSSENIRFSASVAMWGMLLKGSKFKQNANYAKAILLAESARGKDLEGYRAECIRLMKSVQ